MSKNISIADDIYDALRRRKGDRSFSETIRDAVESGGRIADVVGRGVLSGELLADAKEEVRRLSRGTEERMDGDAADEAP